MAWSQMFSVHTLYLCICVSVCRAFSVTGCHCCTNSVIFFSGHQLSHKHLWNHSWHYRSWCKCHCDVHAFSNLSVNWYFLFLTFHLGFLIDHKHAIKCHLLLICHRWLLSHWSFLCTRLHSCVKLLQSLLSHCVSFSHFLILFCRAIRCCKVPPCSSYSRCRCNHRAHPSR